MDVKIIQKENHKAYVSGEIVGYKVKYPDGVSYTLGLAWPDAKEEGDAGLVFDFRGIQLEDFKAVMEALEKAEADVYVPDLEYEEHKKKMDEREKKWWVRIHRLVEDFSISLALFDWRLSPLFVTRPVNHGKNSELCFKACKGFHFGPLTITW